MDIFRQLLAITVVFLLLWTTLTLLRKKGRMPGWTRIGRTKFVPGVLESRGKLLLSAQHSIHLIRIGDRSIILALHPEGVTLLGDAQPMACAERNEMAAP